MLPDGTGEPTVVSPLDGVRFSIQVRSHEMIVDQTVKGGGADSAPTPIELLGVYFGLRPMFAQRVHHLGIAASASILQTQHG